MTIEHPHQDSPRRPPELALWELPYRKQGLHRHKERDDLRAELTTLKTSYQAALDKIADLSKERDILAQDLTVARASNMQLKNRISELESDLSIASMVD